MIFPRIWLVPDDVSLRQQVTRSGHGPAGVRLMAQPKMSLSTLHMFGTCFCSQDRALEVSALGF